MEKEYLIRVKVDAEELRKRYNSAYWIPIEKADEAPVSGMLDKQARYMENFGVKIENISEIIN